MPAGRRSVRAQLLMAAISNAMSCASQGDYLNAVTNMIAAGGISDFKIPPAPPGMPDVAFSPIWIKWRSFYHNVFPSVFRHVDNVLKSLGANELGVADE